MNFCTRTVRPHHTSINYSTKWKLQSLGPLGLITTIFLTFVSISNPISLNLKPYLSLKLSLTHSTLDHLMSLSLHSFLFYESNPILTTLTTQSLFLSTQPLNPYSQGLIHTYTNNLSPILKIIQYSNYYNN